MGQILNRRRVMGALGGNRFIPFVDAEVKRIFVELWGGADGGTAALNTRLNNTKVAGVAGEMTYEQAASVITLPSRTFYNNSDVILLDDLQYLVNLSNLANEAFNNVPNVTSVTLPPSIIDCASYSLYGVNQYRDVYITDLEKFCNCNFVNQVSQFVSSYGRVYYNGSELTQITVPNSVTVIRGTFCNMANLTQVTLHNGITSILQRSFANSGITSIDIPNSVVSIGAYSFHSCKNLKTMILGSGLVSLSGNHWYMSSLESITSKAMTAPTLGDATFLGVKSGGTLYVPKGSVGYDTWMTGNYSLGSANWTMEEVDM